MKESCIIFGGGGFIGSHILEKLLTLNQKVVGVDDFSTGDRSNLDAVRELVGEARWSNFSFHQGDIRDGALVTEICQGVDVVLHQAALASVPRSIDDPVSSTAVNVTGTVQILFAAHKAGVKRFVYASSSSVYGDEETLPKVEDRLGKTLSPYALSKYTDELYAELFSSVYGIECIGLRYFNVFGPRQNPNGPYAAVMPRWVEALEQGKSCEIYGDGETSRDFCFVANAVQANILAACVTEKEALNTAYNIAVGDRTTLTELFDLLAARIDKAMGRTESSKVVYKPFRTGDVRHSLADISKARRLLGYEPQVKISEGITKYVDWLTASKA